MKIADVMTKNPVIIGEKATIHDAMKKMETMNCGILPVGDSKEIKGIITDRDIMLRALSANKDLEKTLVTEIMTTHVIFCDEDSPLEQVVFKMHKNNIRRILIRDKHQTVSGIVSLGDIVRRIPRKSLLAELLKNTRVA